MEIKLDRKCEGCALNAVEAAGMSQVIQFDNYPQVNQEIIHRGTSNTLNIAIHPDLHSVIQISSSPVLMFIINLHLDSKGRIDIGESIRYYRIQGC
jgi:hypothetical protein